MLFISGNLLAQEYYFTDSQIGCTIQVYQDQQLETVEPGPFLDIPLKAKTLIKNPNYLAFSLNDKVYIAPKNCLQKRVKTIPKAPMQVDNFYLTFEGGTALFSDKSQVPEDYNTLFPSTDPATPISWGKAPSATYKVNYLVQLGFGYGATPNSYYALKVRLLKGAKSDTVSLTDINTNKSTIGTWTYNDLLVNVYLGYQYLFLTKIKKLKVIASGYVGFSRYTSNLTEGTNNFSLSSTTYPVFLIETGPEYRIETQVSLGANLGYEYLGNKSIKADGASNFKSKLSYSNYYSTLLIKYYF